MTYTTWGELRDHLITAFGDTPHPATEQDIIDAYELHPGAIEKAASETIAAVNSGSIRSGWGVLRKKAEKITTPIANPTRSSSVDREKRINRAEQWLRNAGLHFNSGTEITLELFDTGKLLNPFAQAELVRNDDRTVELETYGDRTLIQRIIGLWKELRPLGEKIEAEAEARGQADIKRRKLEEKPCKQPSNSSPSPSSSPPATGSGGVTATTTTPADDIPL